MGLAGPHEVAAHLGVSRQRVHQLMQRAGFPTPVATLAIGKVWRLADIDAWNKQRPARNDRRGAGRTDRHP